jgi:RNA polymerase sigma-70 factor (ECF subfamily)
LTDDDLMQAAAEGQQTAFRELVERWERPLYAFLFRMVGCHEDALDLSQETFLRVHRQARSYRAQGQFRCWLFCIAGNLARSWLRRQRVLRWVRLQAPHCETIADSARSDHGLEQREARRVLEQALARLPVRQRQVLLLQRFGEMTQQEIAATLRTTVPAVESLIQRALNRLRKDLIERGTADESPR